MSLPHDLKSYKADAFQLIEPETAEKLLLVILGGMLFLDWWAR